MGETRQGRPRGLQKAQLTAYLPVEVLARFKDRAKEERRTISEVTLTAVEQYLKGTEAK